jgi:hypothetical protein
MNAGVPSLNDLKMYAYSTASAVGVWEDISSSVSWSVDNGRTYATFTLNEFGYYCTAAWCRMTAELETSVSNFPNPFNPDVESFTNIIYTLEVNSKVTLTIYDVSGRPVRVLEEDVQRSKAIRYRVTWDGRNGDGKIVSNNVYFCVLETEDGKRTVRKIAVLR